jgi:hypothetical protein
MNFLVGNNNEYKFYVTVRFALSEKLALKTPNVLIAFFVDFAIFFRTIDGMLRYDTLGYSKLR